VAKGRKGTKQRARSLEFLNTHIPATMSFVTVEDRSKMNIEFAEAIRDYTRQTCL